MTALVWIRLVSHCSGTMLAFVAYRHSREVFTASAVSLRAAVSGKS
jgi:hypothetical protein